MIIMHTTCHREFGGLEKRIYNESCKMSEHGHQIIIAAPKNTPLMTKCIQKGFKCFPIEFTLKSTLKDYRALKQLYRKLQPDVLNTHGNTDSKIALAAAWSINIPCTILSRHISADVSPSFYNKLLYNQLCRYVFTTADYTTKHLISNLDVIPEKIFTIPSGIIPPEYLPDRDLARVNLTAELNINSNSRFIGFVGRVSEDKGVPCIIKAFLSIKDASAKYLSSKDSLHKDLSIKDLLNNDSLSKDLLDKDLSNIEKISDYHLVIVGDGDKVFIDQLKKMVDQTKYKNFIHFTGFQENTWSYYRAFDCNLLASTEVEGISQSLLEAMYARCPVAGSRIGGTGDIIKHGETGLLFMPGKSEEIAKCILQILTNKTDTDKRVELAFKMVNNRYTIDSMMDQILNIYYTQL
ncbi:MAG: glycosyltransferase family 4 protein [Desulfamplus sp.]|nr:glycosyltransferase family 4 protein [Desulfamplus sp.]